MVESTGPDGRSVVSQRIPISDDLPADVLEVRDYWESRREAGGIPSKSSIQPWDIKDKLGRLCILQVQREPLDFVYRLDGMNVASALQQDMTGKSVRRISPKDYADTVFADLTEALDAGEPALWHLDLNIPPAVYPYLRLILPLSGADGHEIEFLMTFAHNLNQKQGHFPWFKRYGQPD